MTDKSRNDQDHKAKDQAALNKGQQKTGGRPESPEVNVTNARDPDAHGGAAANVIADADAGADDSNNGGAEEIPGAKKDYAEGKDPSKHKSKG